jgi:hypothetical protein
MPTYFENGDEISGKFANQILTLPGCLPGSLPTLPGQLKYFYIWVLEIYFKFLYIILNF